MNQSDLLGCELRRIIFMYPDVGIKYKCTFSRKMRVLYNIACSIVIKMSCFKDNFNKIKNLNKFFCQPHYDST